VPPTNAKPVEADANVVPGGIVAESTPCPLAGSACVDVFASTIV